MVQLVGFQTLSVENFSESWASSRTGGTDTAAYSHDTAAANVESGEENTTVVNVWSTDQTPTDSGQQKNEEPESQDSSVIKATSSGSQSVNVSWEHISLSLEKKCILQDLNGKVRSGELTAIMGPSGAGKTSLLNVLSGFSRKYSGRVMVNGAERGTKNYRKLSCYVVQDNNVLGYLTVKESVSLAAALKLPNTISDKEKTLLVEKILISLGLSDVEGTRAGQLSGGQKKRLCIAQEIVNNPPLIFLDEPTSGLDSSSSLQCIKLLKSLASEGRTVVCTIHQPSARIFELLDKLYLLTNGQCMYRGQASKLVDFMEELGLSCPQYHNPADFVMEVVMGEHGDWNPRFKEIVDGNNASEEEDDIVTCSEKQMRPSSAVNLGNGSYENVNEKNPTKASWLKSFFREQATTECPTSFTNQFRTLTYRNFINNIRNPIITHIQIVMYIVTGLFIGAMFYGIGPDAGKIQDNVGFVFFCLLFAMFGPKMATVITFPLERIVISREYLNNWYDVKAYFLARTLNELPFQFILPILFSTIAYWMTSQPPEAIRFILFTIILIEMAIVGQSLCLILGAVLDPQSAVYMSVAVSIPIAIFSGFFVTFDTMPVYLSWLSYLSYARYSFQGATLTLYGMNRTLTECSKFLCMKPKNVLNNWDIRDEDAYIYFGVLILFAVVFKIVGYYVVRYKLNAYKNS